MVSHLSQFESFILSLTSLVHLYKSNFLGLNTFNNGLLFQASLIQGPFIELCAVWFLGLQSSQGSNWFQGGLQVLSTFEGHIQTSEWQNSHNPAWRLPARAFGTSKVWEQRGNTSKEGCMEFILGVAQISAGILLRDDRRKVGQGNSKCMTNLIAIIFSILSSVTNPLDFAASEFWHLSWGSQTTKYHFS